MSADDHEPTRSRFNVEDARARAQQALRKSEFILSRAYGLLREPKKEWEQIRAEETTVPNILIGYVAPLAAIIPVCSLIGSYIFEPEYAGDVGVALIRAQRALKGLKLEESDEQIGVDIIRRSLEEPMRMIAYNAGAEGSIVVEKVRSSKDDQFGYNALTDTYENLVTAGVIDPTKVARTALQNAASIASLLLTTEALIVEKKEEKPAPAGPPGGGMGGMY